MSTAAVTTMETSQEPEKETITYNRYFTTIKSGFFNLVGSSETSNSKQRDDKVPSSNPPPILTSHGNNLLNLVVDYQTNLPIAEVIYEYLDLPTVVNLFNTSKHLRVALDNYKYHQRTRKWDINKRLRPFVNDAVGFRRKLARCEAVMTGTFALDFFSPTDNIPIFLDIIQLSLPWTDSRVFDIIGWLIEHEEYQVYHTARYLHPSTDISFQTCLVRNDYQEGQPMIRVLRATTAVLEPILKRVGSTHLLNVIGTNTAYCLYPNQTLIGKEMHLLNLQQVGGWHEQRLGGLRHHGTGNTRFMAGMGRFLGSGWRFATVDQDVSPFEPWPEHGTRSPCDSWTLRVPLSTRGVIDEDSTAITVDNYIDIASWNASQTLVYPDFWSHALNTDHPPSCAELDTTPVKHPCLRSMVPCGLKKEPTYHPWQPRRGTTWQSWGEFLAVKLEEARQATLRPVTQAERSLMLPWLGWRQSSDLDGPMESWYRNGEVRKWFWEWKKQVCEGQVEVVVEEVEPKVYSLAASLWKRFLALWQKGC